MADIEPYKSTKPAQKLDNDGNNGLMVLINSKMESDAESLIYGLQSDVVYDYLFHRNKYGDTPLLLACQNKMYNLALLICSDSFVEYSVANVDKNLDDINAEHNTALIWACLNDMPKIADILIENKLSPFCVINSFGETPLITCCRMAMNKQAIAILKNNDCLPSHIDSDNITALLWACKNNLIDVVKELLKHDCNVYHKRKNISALATTFKSKHYEIVKLLLEYDNKMLNLEEIDIVLDIVDKFNNDFNFNGVISNKDLINEINNTSYEYLADVQELIKHKVNIETRPYKIRECIICANECDTAYCFNVCGHVVYYHDSCINGTKFCPFCRSAKGYIKCYINKFTF